MKKQIKHNFLEPKRFNTVKVKPKTKAKPKVSSIHFSSRSTHLSLSTGTLNKKNTHKPKNSLQFLTPKLQSCLNNRKVVHPVYKSLMSIKSLPSPEKYSNVRRSRSRSKAKGGANDQNQNVKQKSLIHSFSRKSQGISRVKPNKSIKKNPKIQMIDQYYK